MYNDNVFRTLFLHYVIETLKMTSVHEKSQPTENELCCSIKHFFLLVYACM